MHRQAAVDEEQRACREAGLFGGEEDGYPDQVVRAPEPTERLGVDQKLLCVKRRREGRGSW